VNHLRREKNGWVQQEKQKGEANDPPAPIEPAHRRTARLEWPQFPYGWALHQFRLRSSPRRIRRRQQSGIPRDIDIPVAKVRKVPKIAQQSIPLETPVGEEEDSHLGDFIEDRSVVSPAEAAINVNLKDETEQGPAHADPARRKGNQDALRTGRRQRTNSGRSRPIVRGNPRTHPPDRSQGAEETAASVEVADVAGVYGWG